MSDVYEKVNILRANAHESKLPTIPDGRFTLSHELIGVITREELKQICVKEGIQIDHVNGFEFYDTIMEKVMQLVMEGYSVQTDWLHSMITLSGTVPAERLGHNAQPGEVAVKASFSLGKRAREMVGRLQVFVHDHVSTGEPVIQSIADPTAEAANELNVGEMVLIKGLNITVLGDQMDKIGVFFTPVGGGARVHISAGKFSPNTPSSVQFVLPAAVTAGEWMVKLATQATKNKDVFAKEVRASVYATPVLVKAPAGGV